MAIIGRGNIAQVIPDREGFVFYANGCSNRKPLTNLSAEKEFHEIVTQFEKIDNEMFVYISGLNIYYKDGDGRKEYTEHKIKMENLVKDNFKNYCIFRIGSITWGDNPNTLINFLKQNPHAEAKPVYRYLHTKEELRHWLDMIPRTGKHEMNVTGQRFYVPELARQIHHNYERFIQNLNKE